MIILELQWWQILLAVVVAVIGSARLTRLITHDAFPPVARARVWWEDHTPEPWHLLVHCPWCMGPWMFALAIGTFFLTFLAPWLAWVWWIFYVWMAGSYFVSQYVHFDEGMG